MTYDDIINGDHWNGTHLALRKRMAEYRVDGRRLGEIAWNSRSGSPDDPTLAKTDGEILTAALALGQLGYERVELRAHDADGKPLETPDLDAAIEGRTVGIEVAEIPGAAKHDALRNGIEVAVRGLLRGDEAFAAALGGHHLSVNLNPIGTVWHAPIEGKREAEALLADLVAFVRAGLAPADGLQRFPPEYRALAAREAEYNLDALTRGPYFALGDGPRYYSQADRTADALKILDRHRASAAKHYRALPETWIVLFLPDDDEIFRRTALAAERKRPDIAPFDRCILLDTAGTVVEIKSAEPVGGGTVA